MIKTYADIIVDITSEKLDRSFQYLVPQHLEGRLQPGMQVQVPFGNGGRMIKGYVIRVTDQPSFDVSRMKEIRGVETGSNSIESRLIALAAWMREQYGATMIQALKTVLPVKQKMKQKEKRWIRLLLEKDEAENQLELCRKKHYVARQRLLEALLENDTISYTLAMDKLHLTASVIKTMENTGMIRVQATEVYRNPIQTTECEQTKALLSPAQREVADGILNGWRENDFRPVVIHGVTGSGKTQVYMELMEEVLNQGKQVILLIPEIALTYQTVQRFYRRFGDRISVLHSRLSPGERSDQFERAKKGELQVMIGPRSALFTPFPNLGLIVIDEEHETSYQSETVPCYHARETAIERGNLEHCPVVLGSATPSVDAYYQAQNGTYRLIEQNSRYENRQMPKVYSVDLRKELKQGNRSILSSILQEKIEERLKKKEQIMLFLNRRGYAGFFSCRSCGTVMKCPHCDVSLSEHNGNRLICHYCGYETVKPEICPSCGSPHIGGFKAGTQQIEKVIEKEFPKARVLRMDFDTTRTKDSYEKILASFAKHEADILVGTQMIVKGHDFPNVTLVGVIAADLSLNMDDYHCGERTFQLLTQAVGRSGRGNRPGQAVIQTYQPEHYSIQAAAIQDYEKFYKEEMGYRMLLDYPPAAHMMTVFGACQDEELLKNAMYYIEVFIRRVSPKEELHMIGPAAASVGKVKDVYRQVIHLKHSDICFLTAVREKLEKYIEINSGFRKIYIQFDMN